MSASRARDEAIDAFLAQAGWGAARRQPLPADASTRSYTRLRLGERSALLMNQPQGAEAPTAAPDATPETRRAAGYNAVARLAGAHCARFVAAARYLRGRGLAAPDIYAADTAQGLLLLEDLGDDLYTDVIARGGDETALYARAVEALAVLHAEPAPALLAPDLPLFAYDETALLAETDLLTEWFLPAALGRAPDPADADEHTALWREALQSAASSPAIFVHRDYHAQNLLWRGERAGLLGVGIIDFQDAVAGAPAYDLVSLLEDARRDVSPELAHAMTAHYLAARTRAGARPDKEHFQAQAALFAAQRNAKIIGIFARLAMRDAKPRYLAYLPRVWRYMEGDLAHPDLRRLKTWYGRMVPAEARGALKLQGERP